MLKRDRTRAVLRPDKPQASIWRTSARKGSGQIQSTNLNASRYSSPRFDFKSSPSAYQVYELVGSRWVDQGTAFCFGQFQEDTNEAFLVARAALNYNNVILSTPIRTNDVYQQQAGTLSPSPIITLPPSKSSHAIVLTSLFIRNAHSLD